MIHMLKRSLKRPTAVFGMLIVLAWILCALFANWLAPYDPLQIEDPLLVPMSLGSSGHFHWLGTDMLGRDILSRLIFGARTVIIWSGLATAAAFLIGIASGLVAGFYRGLTDRVMSFIANAVLSFPVLVLYLVIIVKFGASPGNIVIAVVFAHAPAIFRIVRGLTADIGNREYVLASITQGESAARIMAFDILPNAAGPLVVDACLRVGYTAITIGVLGFLGVGLPPPTPDWGGMIEEGRSMAMAFPHLVIFPCIAISSLMLGLSLIADGMRQGLKPVPVANETRLPE